MKFDEIKSCTITLTKEEKEDMKKVIDILDEIKDFMEEYDYTRTYALNAEEDYTCSDFRFAIDMLHTLYHREKFGIK